MQAGTNRFEAEMLIGLEKKNKFFKPNIYIFLYKNIFYPRRIKKITFAN